MANLEDNIFKQNIPGRWSSLDDTSDIRKDADGGDEGEISGDESNDNYNGDSRAKSGAKEMTEYDRLLYHSSIPQDVKRGVVAERNRKNGTGIKGVLADYAAEQSLKQAEREHKAAMRDQVLHRMVTGAVVPSAVPTDTIVMQGASDCSDDDEDEDDKKFMEEFRAARIRELKATSQAIKTYNSVSDVSSSEALLQEVEACDPRTTIVVHFYEPSIQACVLLNRHFEELAALWTDVRFIRVKASDTSLMIDRVALPAISVYRGGDVINVMAGIVEELGDRFVRDDIEWMLESSEGWVR